MDLMIVGAATAARLGGGAAGCVRVAVQFGWACGERGIGLPLYYSWLAKAELLRHPQLLRSSLAIFCRTIRSIVINFCNF